MLGKLKLTLLCMTALFASTAFSGYHTLTPNMSMDFEFPPNEPQVFVNFLFWQIKAECIVTMEEPVTPVSAKSTKKTSVVNGKALPRGETFTMDLKSKDKLVVAADAGAEVVLTNLGTKTIVASCSTL